MDPKEAIKVGAWAYIKFVEGHSTDKDMGAHDGVMLMMFSLYETLRAAGKVTMPEHYRAIFRIVGAVILKDSCDSEEEALAAYREARVK